MSIAFAGPGAPLSLAGFDTAIQALSVEPAAFWSLLTVETKGFGYQADRRPKILFERHWFHKLTNGRFSTPANADISNPVAGGYIGGPAEYDRLNKAIALDRAAALQSASWGLPQVMGFNAKSMGYTDAEDMVARFVASEDNQVDGLVRFLTTTPGLADAMRRKDWAGVAQRYNGPNYAQNQYDTKLGSYYAKYSAGTMPDLTIRAAQVYLTYLGYDPKGVDGIRGNGLRAALTAFQTKSGLPATGALDGATADQLRNAAMAGVAATA